MSHSRQRKNSLTRHFYAFFTYVGGKNLLLPVLLPLVPPHKVYVEPFGGAANLLLAKEPCPVEVYNDISPVLANLFRVLTDKALFPKWFRMVALTLYSREEMVVASRHLSAEGNESSLEKAWDGYVSFRQSFGGKGREGWGFCVTEYVRITGTVETLHRWVRALEWLPLHAKRCENLIVLNQDFREVFPQFDSPETFFYCDPPYVPETVKDNFYGEYNMSLEDHQDLVQILLSCKGKVLLSGYQHSVYEPLERAGWWRLDVPSLCCVVGRVRVSGLNKRWSATQKQPRTESLWLNYPPPVIPPQAFVAVTPLQKG